MTVRGTIIESSELMDRYHGINHCVLAHTHLWQQCKVNKRGIDK